jgi:hypothetical protein
MPVEKQFSTEELMRIANACRHTQQLNIEMHDEQDEIEVKKEVEAAKKHMTEGGLYIP